MKRILFILLSSLVISLQLKAEGYDGGVVFENQTFEERDGFLHLSFRVHVSSLAVTKCTAMRVFPELVGSGDKVYYFPYIEATGKNREKMNKRRYKLIGKKRMAAYEYPYIQVNVKPKTDTLLNYEISVPYEEWMAGGALVLRQEMNSCRDEHRLYTHVLSRRLGDEVAATGSQWQYVPVPDDTFGGRTPSSQNLSGLAPLAVAVNASVALAIPDDTGRERDVQGVAYLNFPAGHVDIQPNFRNNGQELRKLRATLTGVCENADVAEVLGLSITGYASPEGSYELNERLARNRTVALRDYIARNYNLPINGADIAISSVAEDWDGLKKLVEASFMPYRDEVLNIIEFYGIWDGREKHLMNLAGGQPYRMMMKEFFPQLRRVEYKMDYVVRNYTLDEIKAMVGKKDKYLNHFELFLAAESFGKKSPKYKQIFLNIIPRYYSDEVANNNAAAILLESGDLTAAQRYINNAGNLPEAQNNLGVLYMKRGDFDRAEPLFINAYRQGVKEAANNLNELKRLRSIK